MTSIIKVDRGIYIDNACMEIKHISNGYFIPGCGQTSDTDQEYREELAAFLQKWFQVGDEDTKDCV